MKQYRFRQLYICSCLIVLLSVTSCKKYLEIPVPNDQVSDATIFTTKPTIITAVNGMYSAFANQSTIVGTRLRSLYWLSDEGELSPAPGNEIGDMIIANIVATNQWFPPWSYFYTPIFRANQLIENLPSVPVSILPEGERKRYIAAAKYVRAACHFMLVTAWGDVPLVLTTNTTINASIARTPAAEVYNSIVKDLQDAAADLPPTVNTSSSRDIHNRLQPLAFLSRVYLYMGKWAEAETAASDVISSGQYLMVSGVNNVFKRGSREAILSMAETATSASFLNRTALGWYTLPATVGNTQTLHCSIPTAILNQFQVGDQRAVDGNWIVTLFGKKFANKYLYSLAATSTPTVISANPQDYIFQRFAELYLIRAEARAQQDKITGATSAIPDINTIRTRAGLPNTTSVTKAEILIAIEKERQFELFYEGHRWFDLKRTGRLNAVLSAVPYKAANYKPYFDLWPISYKELDANPNLVQNPGYW